MIMGLQFIYVDGVFDWEMKVLGNPKIVLMIQLVRMDIGLFKANIFLKKKRNEWTIRTWGRFVPCGGG